MSTYDELLLKYDGKSIDGIPTEDLEKIQDYYTHVFNYKGNVHPYWERLKHIENVLRARSRWEKIFTKSDKHVDPRNPDNYHFWYDPGRGVWEITTADTKLHTWEGYRLVITSDWLKHCDEKSHYPQRDVCFALAKHIKRQSEKVEGKLHTTRTTWGTVEVPVKPEVAPQRCHYHTSREIEKCIRHIPEAKTPQLPKHPNTNPEDDHHENHVMEWEDAREAEVRAHVQQSVREWPYCAHADAPVELEFDWKFEGDQDIIIPYFICPYCKEK